MKNLYIRTLTNTPVGPVTIAASDLGALFIEIGSDIRIWQNKFNRLGFETAAGEPNEAIARELHEYFRGTRSVFEMPLDWSLTTPFQKTVMQAVRAVPYGETSTYSAIAAVIGKPKAVRAVGRANATNPLTIVLPCHRLIGADGELRGFRAPDGIRTKAWLIEHERQHRSG